MDKKAVLVTGATGFIGSHVARGLADSGKYRIVAVVRQTDHYKNTDELSADGVLLVKGIFYDEKVLGPLFREYRIEYVIHLAALRGAGKQGSYDEVNVNGTERLLEASLRNKVRRFIFCSSVGVFGTIPCEVPATTDTRLNGDTVYHNSKIRAEEAVKKYMEKGLDAFIVRPSITYGKGDDGFSATLIKLVRKRWLFLPKYPSRIHLLDVKSLAELFCTLLAQHTPHTKIMAMADESPILLSDLANLISRFYFGKDYPSRCRISPHLFTAIEETFRLVGSEKWTTRIQLISKDWFYDVNPIQSIPGVQIAKTEQNFLRYLKDGAV